MKPIKFEGNVYEYDVVAQYFEDDIREDLHLKMAPCSEQEFFNAYMERDPGFMERYEMYLFPTVE